MTLTTDRFSPLRATLAGAVHVAGDDGYDQARAAWNLAADLRPAAVVAPVDSNDVVEVVRFADSAGLRVCAQSTGHGATAHSDLSGSILIRTDAMRDLTVNAGECSCRVEAGVRWGEVALAAAAHGLAAPAGTAADVGVAGYMLGGGLSWMARKYGLACDLLTAVEIVDGSGVLRRVDTETDPDLFWAIRGGGGNFGIVTALEFSLLPIESLVAGALFFPFERAGEVLSRWRAWTEMVPEDVTSLGRVLHVPPLPEIPEPLRGQSFVLIEAAMLATDDQADELVAPLRALDPLMDTICRQTPSELLELHMDPPGPMPALGDHQLLDSLSDEVIARVVKVMQPGSPITSLEFRHLEGALGRRPEGSGALGALDGRFASFAVGVVAEPALSVPLAGALADLREALSGHDTGSSYSNFAETPTASDAIFGARTLERLRQVKRTVDPNGLLHGNHRLDPEA